MFSESKVLCHMYDYLSFIYSLIKCYVQSSLGFSYVVHIVTCLNGIPLK